MLKNKIQKKFALIVILMFSMSFVSAQPTAPTAESCYEQWKKGRQIIDNINYGAECQGILEDLPTLPDSPTPEERVLFTVLMTMVTKDYEYCMVSAEGKYFADMDIINTSYDECMELVEPEEEEG